MARVKRALNAKKKRRVKGADWIVANDVSPETAWAGFPAAASSASASRAVGR